MTHILDTDHLSILQRRGGTDYAVLAASLSQHQDTDIGVTIVSLHEQAIACNALINNFRNQADVLLGYELMARTIADFRRFTMVPFDAAAQGVFDQLKGAKIRVGTMDLRIAAIALSRNLAVVTRNARDFSQVPGSTTED